MKIGIIDGYEKPGEERLGVNKYAKLKSYGFSAVDLI